MDPPNTDTNAELDAIVETALEGISLNGREGGFKNYLAFDLAKRRAEPMLRRAADTGFDLPDIAAHSIPFDAEAASRPVDWSVDRVAARGSNSLLIAPSNAGGSTLLSHIASAYLLERQVLGLFRIARGPYRVLWVNPEEAPEIVNQRLAAEGVTAEDADETRWWHIHSRDDRLYLNNERHVEHLIDTARDRGWLDDDRPLAIFVDGVQPTLRGKVWGEDLEAWKNGVGTIRDALGPVAVYVRTQVLSSATRGSKRGADIAGEDASGGQIFTWPDHRLTLNRLSDQRTLNVRGRYEGQEGDGFDVTYERDSSGRLIGVDASIGTLAIMRVTEFLGGDEWQGLERRSKRAVAEHLTALDKTLEATQPKYQAVSLSSYRRAMEHWTYDEDRDEWRGIHA